ncbi:hypothetical protein [Ornithinimicrobium cerasi]|uniref:Uncharacterized protein n=1 Tax=Ornithinimicrobium cerasi TaxID=2248773 RepID=A0A285VL01_9MICO|nr:hypothetical protein [Ornithinimicrobium cerasi]SOC53886.1 hypothetical protein SAMN05421879_102244 [Ornithinimicrobium cerasi]
MTGPDQRVGADVELERVVRRWQQLPLDRALPAGPGFLEVVQSLADAVSDAEGMPHDPVPDLGAAVLPDQLRVMVHDWRSAGLAEEELAQRLTALRRALP